MAVGGDTWRVVDRFASSYYSGLDIRVYLGDVCLTDVVGLAFEIRENVTPLYGYASYRYDRVARGVRIIQGQFTINFRKPYWLIHEALKASRLEAAAKTPSSESRKVTPIEHSESYADILRWVEQQRTKFWRSGEGRDMPSSSRLGRDEESPLWNTGGIRYDLRIRYGDPTLRREQVLVTLAEDESAMLLGRDGPGVTTMTEVISDVQITGVSRAFDDSGRNLLEAYSFLARDYKISV